MRVPPDQSGAAAPARASTVSGRAVASSAVIRVSRVANVNTSVRLVPAGLPPVRLAPVWVALPWLAQYSSWSMARAYGSIDAEMSHSTTSRRGRRRGARGRDLAPVRRPCAGPGAGSSAGPGGYRPPRCGTGGSGAAGWPVHAAASASSSCSSSAADRSAKSRLASRSARGHRPPGHLAVSLLWLVAADRRSGSAGVERAALVPPRRRRAGGVPSAGTGFPARDGRAVHGGLLRRTPKAAANTRS